VSDFLIEEKLLKKKRGWKNECIEKKVPRVSERCKVQAKGDRSRKHCKNVAESYVFAES